MVMRGGVPITAMQTYAIRAPRETHTRPATCQDVDCQMYAEGFVSRIDERTELGRRQAYYIRVQSGRRFDEERGADGLTVFTFGPGQPCFAEHRASLERAPLFLIRDGDGRGNPTGRAVSLSPEDWRDDMHETLDRVRETRERG